MSGQILLADDAGLAEATLALIAKVPNAPEIVAVADGRAAMVAYTKMIASGRPPALIVVDTELPRIGGLGVLRACRAVERAFGHPAVAAMIYAPVAADASMKAFLAEVGRAVHLARPADQPIGEQARRCLLAARKLMAQVNS